MKHKRDKEPISVLISVIDYTLIFLTLGVFLLLRYIFRFFKRVYISHLAEYKTEKLLKSSMKKIDRMDGKSFEIYLCALFKGLGYRAESTKASNDYGADLLIKKGFKKIAVQAKCYKRNVSVKAVQEAHTSITHYKTGEAWVVTNSGFTAQARRLADETGVILIDRQGLEELMGKL